VFVWRCFRVGFTHYWPHLDFWTDGTDWVDAPECIDNTDSWELELQAMSRLERLKLKLQGRQASRCLVRTQLGRSESVVLDRRLFRFESQLLSFRLPVKVSVFGADLIALNLSEASQRIGDGTTCRRRAVHERTGVGAV